MDPLENANAVVTLCAGAVVVDSVGRLLVVLRRNEPSSGCWSLPGGRVEDGEIPAAAAAREVLEETGLYVQIGAELGVVSREYVDESGRPHILEIHDFAATVSGGRLVAGDDALDAGWKTLDELRGADLSPGLLEFLENCSVPLA